MSYTSQNMIDPDNSSLLRAVPGCHLFLRPDPPGFTVLEVTEDYLEATLLDRSMITGKRLFEVFSTTPSIYHPTDIKDLNASMLWVLEHKRVQHMNISRDGDDESKGTSTTRVRKAMNKPVFNKAGDVQYLIHTVEEVDRQVVLLSSEAQAQSDLMDAARKLTQQRHLTETILTASLNGIYALEAIRDPVGTIQDFRYVFANKTIAQYVNMEVKDMVGSSVLELIPENRSNGFFDYFCHILGKGQPDRQQTYFTSKNFTGWFDFTVIPISGDVLVVTTQDITELKANQLRLEQTVQELKRSNENLEEFAHAASHDLKEPIRKIRFFTYLLKDQLHGQLKESESRHLNKIESASERLAKLIDDLQLYSHVNHRPHEKEAVDLQVQFRRILEELELDIQEKGAHVHIGTLPHVQGYRRQLQQLFQNLISNALKFSTADVTPEITVTSESDEIEGKHYHVVIVRDNGIGFEQEQSEKIFQIFTRLNASGSYSGAGVGLSIARKVAENHHGFIRVFSKPKEGTVFKVYLPAN